MAKQKQVDVWDLDRDFDNIKNEFKQKQNKATINDNLKKIEQFQNVSDGKFLTLATKTHLKLILKDIPGFNPEYIKKQIEELENAKGIDFSEQIQMLKLQQEFINIRLGKVSYKDSKEKFNAIYNELDTAKKLKIEISDIKEKINDLALGRKVLSANLDTMTDDHKIAYFVKEFRKYYTMFKTKVLGESYDEDMNPEALYTLMEPEEGFEVVYEENNRNKKISVKAKDLGKTLEKIGDYISITPKIVNSDPIILTEKELQEKKNEYTELCVEIAQFILEHASRQNLVKWGFTVNNGNEFSDVNDIVHKIWNADNETDHKFTPDDLRKKLKTLESDELKHNRMELAKLLSKQKHAFDTYLSENDVEILIRDFDIFDDVEEKSIKDVLVLTQVELVQRIASKLKVTQNIKYDEDVKDIIAEGLLYVNLFYEKWKKDQKESIENGEDVILSFNVYCGASLSLKMEQYCLSMKANGTYSGTHENKITGSLSDMAGAKKSVRFSTYRNNVRSWINSHDSEERKRLDNMSPELVNETYYTELVSTVRQYSLLVQITKDYIKIRKYTDSNAYSEDVRKKYLDEFYFKYGRIYDINYKEYVDPDDKKKIENILQDKNLSQRSKFTNMCDILAKGGYVADWKKELRKYMTQLEILKESAVIENTVSETELRSYYNGAMDEEDYNPLDIALNANRDLVKQSDYDIDRSEIEDYQVLGDSFESMTRICNIITSSKKELKGEYVLTDTPLFRPAEIVSVAIMGSLVDTKKIVDYKMDKFKKSTKDDIDIEYGLTDDKLSVLTGIKNIKANAKNFFAKRETYLKNLKSYGDITKTLTKEEKIRVNKDIRNLKDFKNTIKSIGEKLLSSPDSYYMGQTMADIVGSSKETANEELEARLRFGKRFIDIMNDYDKMYPKKADKTVTKFVNEIIHIDKNRIVNN